LIPRRDSSVRDVFIMKKRPPTTVLVDWAGFDLIKAGYGKKVKLSRYTPWRHIGGDEVQLLLILNLGTRWG
jgi:hypothetical protein